MKNVNRIGALVLAGLLVVAPVFAAGDMTVGGFVVKLAKAKNLNATDSRIALDSLAGIGIVLPGDMKLSQRLTEGDVARISRLAGLNVTTTQPTAPFDQEQVERFFGTFSIELAPGFGGGGGGAETNNHDDGGGPAFNPYAKGKGGSKGQKKGHDFTPDEPE